VLRLLPCTALQELPDLLSQHFSSQLDLSRVSIMGHSMGGHGALTIALKNPGRWDSVLEEDVGEDVYV
jgi:S-formylglutathione hydrolase